ncbi:DUF6233 domain-containing protein [Streptomyces sp. E5N298]|uniref:DUF6233 domain-containing protein n=1 Tax=Streptomyces sp. E5N298 TaxID=1851983 RepID=UPI001EE92DE9|nr:DUF6233 domain-containing protein [Streptomyces sp. E5N298]
MYERSGPGAPCAAPLPRARADARPGPHPALDRRRGTPRARTPTGCPGPAGAADWLLEQGLNRNSPPVQVHCGDCWNKGKRTLGIRLDVARRALIEGVKACGACRPDSRLGLLD